MKSRGGSGLSFTVQRGRLGGLGFRVLQKDVHPSHEEHHDNLFLSFNCCRGSREGCGAKALEP